MSNIGTHAYPERAFPMVALYFNAAMEVLGTEVISGPGVLRPRRLDEPAGVQLMFADGSIEVTPPPPYEVWQAGEAGDPMPYTDWFFSLCANTDDISGVGKCWKERDHEPPCELKMLERMPSNEGSWGVRSIAFIPTWLTELLMSDDVGELLDDDA